nr:hypothetical protein BSM_27890 [uncultured archaeon]
MRIIIDLRATKDQGYVSMYHHKLQGFVYGLLRDSSFEMLHDKTGYKFFYLKHLLSNLKHEFTHISPLLLF